MIKPMLKNARWLILFGLAVIVQGTPQVFAQEVTLFGPETFTRATGQPIVVERTLSVSAGVQPPFILIVENGGAGGTNRVSSASIFVNDVEVVRENDFNQRVGNIRRNVPLGSTNTLRVRLRSAPGSFLSIRIIGTQSLGD